MDDKDLISFIISGLHPSYTLFVTSFSFVTYTNLINLDDFQAELLNHEILLETQQKSIPPETGSFVLFRNKGNKNFNPHKF